MLSVFETPPLPPCPREFNLAGYVLGHANDRPDKIALQIVRPSGAERWSYARLNAAVLGAAAGLLGLGLTPGDRVLLRLGNTIEFPIAFLGAIAAGLIPVPTSTQLTSPELEWISTEIRPRLIVAGAGIPLPENRDCHVISEAELRAFENLPPAIPVLGDPERPAYIIYTSGSSGQPRAVVHAHRAVWARRMMWDGWYGLRESDRLLHAGAFNWTYTLGTGLMDPWAVGATALIPGAGVTSDQLFLLLKRFDATIFAAAPGVYRQMLKRGDRVDLPRLRHGLAAGEKLSEATRAAWEGATGTLICEALGMSECSTFVSASPAHPAPEGAIGYPQEGRHVAVLDESGAPVAHGEPGVLAVHRSDPGLFLGYLDNEAETKSRFRGDWFVTGDMVSMAEDGAITYLGRNDDMMNAGGYRVSPLEVEAAMHACPDAGDVAAIEARLKQDVSVIALFHTGPATEEALKAHAEDRLARYKQPRLYIRREALPLGANGKVNRRKLREEWEAGL
ncbi:class I adenylate-forming enzyme family protein [Ostreiculturibacter nitratireducens]|uniref:class I adenylate-forming enzyme family protein n=1 Tax=Ostreiculturibacter nitratireducens TaxID=3075226 RepID=UPI0031B5BAC9